tara:strand:+ start:12112 stop:15156 length:3045 start_codon:yes stop_codon:yes gene_type:complete
MIGTEIALNFLEFTPLAAIACAVAMVVLRASGSRVFFDVVGTWQATKMLTDANATATVLESLYMDSLMAIQEAGSELAQMFDFVDEVMPLTQEIENARVEFEKFVDNMDEAKALENQIQDIGLAFGFAADEAFVAGARMAQLSGVLGGQGSTAVGTEMGMMFGLISGMETEAAMQRLINLNQQTKFMTENIEEGMEAQEKANIIRRDTIRVLDQLNTVENRSAATMTQITFVMNQFASQAHLTNESIAAMAAMSATLIEAGEEQGKGGRALRMIYARLGADTNGARSELERLGIAVYDADGAMRPFSDLLEELAVHYEGMNDKQKMATVQTVAGNRHYTRLIKLLENVDRVRELELEALLAQFPARDELQRRLDSEIFKYEQAEASLKNYSAAFGDSMLPALTKVTEQQALFYKTLVGFTEGRFGGILSGFIMMTRLMSNFVGPTAAAIIAIKNLQIAMQTQILVTRALRGEQIAGNMTQTQTALQQGILLQKTREQVMVIEQENKVRTEQSMILRDKLMLQIQESNNLQKTAQQRNGHRLQVTMLIRKLQELGITVDVLSDKEMGAKVATDLLNNSMLQSSLAATQLSMKLGGLGSIFMMFSESERGMRVGMVLTTAAMAVQMFQVYKSITAMQQKNVVDARNIVVEQTANITYRQQIASIVSLTTAKKALASATTMAATATRGLTLALKTLLKATVIFAVIDFALRTLGETIGLFNDNIEDIKVDAMAGQIADTALVMDYLTMSTTELNAALEYQDTLIQGVAENTDSTSTRIVNAANAEIIAINEVLQMRELEEIQLEGSIDRVNEYIDAKEELKRLEEGEKKAGWLGLGTKMDWLNENVTKKLFGRWGVGEGSIANALTGGLVDDKEEAAKIVEDFAIDFVDLHDFMKDRHFENYADMEHTLLEYIRVANNIGEDEWMGGLGSSIEAATDEIYNFNNAREELFYGFASDRLTGDLVRQVHQQGVETLITTTEVIMTNNFNGMTTAEVAQEILDEIENGAKRRNINIDAIG